jgi:hypothetical protein
MDVADQDLTRLGAQGVAFVSQFKDLYINDTISGDVNFKISVSLLLTRFLIPKPSSSYNVMLKKLSPNLPNVTRM